MKKQLAIMLLLAALLLQSCKKDFLDVKPSKALLVPQTLADFQALLDNNFVFNNTPGLSYIADGDFYTTGNGYNAFGQDMERNSYTWAKDIYAGQPTADWDLPYEQVFYANVVLEGLGKLAGGPSAEQDAIKGSALFFRAYAYFNLVQQFALPFNPATSATDPGVPLRLHADVTLKPGRGTVQQVYDQVLSDLAAARQLLPRSAAYKSRPTLNALLSLQARVALSMGNYTAAGKYADSVIASGVTLIDYNTLNPAASRPFPRALPDGNDEVIFYAALSSYSFLTSASATYIDSNLYRSYAPNDLRKQLFCRLVQPGIYRFKGNYAGTLVQFSGLAADELYLISAESKARTGDAAGAMAMLNSLLVTRWVTGTFVPYTAAGADDALAQVLAERRKELIGRALRWGDLRRLNSDPRFRVTLVRSILGQTYTLPPGSPRYAYPIPQEEIGAEGIAQNPR